MALTKFNYNSFDLTTAASKGLAFNSSANGFETSSSTSMVLIKTLTASSSSTLSFVDGSSSVVLDNTYPVYLFKYINIHPATDSTNFSFQGNAAGGSGYNETITSTYFKSEHDEGGSSASLGYDTDFDQAQGTGFQTLVGGLGNGNDESASGQLYLFNPSSTTFVKHFLGVSQYYHKSNYSNSHRAAGYFNTTSAIDEIQFKMSSGNIDAGTIKLYGIKDS